MRIFIRLIAVCVLLAFTFVLSGCRQMRYPNWYFIPIGYVGWVEIEYKVSGASPLSQRDGHNVLNIPSSGSLKTSSEPETGSAKDEYFYFDRGQNYKINSEGREIKGNMIWGEKLRIKTVKNGNSSDATDSPTIYMFFVGTEEQYDKTYRSQKGKEKIGDIKSMRSQK